MGALAREVRIIVEESGTALKLLPSTKRVIQVGIVFSWRNSRDSGQHQRQGKQEWAPLHLHKFICLAFANTNYQWWKTTDDSSRTGKESASTPLATAASSLEPTESPWKLEAANSLLYSSSLGRSKCSSPSWDKDSCVPSLSYVTRSFLSVL